MTLPLFKTDDKSIGLMQTAWAQQLNPVVELPINSGVIINGISLVIGDNTINHTLGRKLQGWVVVGMHNAFSQIFDKQSTNQMSNLTLILNSSAITKIDLLVF